MCIIYVICICSCDIPEKNDMSFPEMQPYSKKLSNSASSIIFPNTNCRKITPHTFGLAFHTQFWGMGRCFGSTLGTTAAGHWLWQCCPERKRVLPQGLLEMHESDPPSAESSVFMTKTSEKQQFSCIFRCGPSAKSGVQEKLKFGRLKGVLGGPEAHI